MKPPSLDARLSRARRALSAHLAGGRECAAAEPPEAERQLAEALSGLLHLAAAQGLAPERLALRALSRYAAESADPRPALVEGLRAAASRLDAPSTPVSATPSRAMAAALAHAGL